VTSLGRSAVHRVHVVSSDRAARVRWSRHVASFTRAPADDDARFDLLQRVTRRVRADVVLPVCETGVRLLQQRGHELPAGVALAPCSGTLDVGDKWLLAAMLRDHGLPHPPTWPVTGTADVDAFPLLLKPRRMSGGWGIHEFADRASLAAHLARHPEVTDDHVLQAFVPGSDLGVNVLCERGRVLAWSVQRPVAGAAGCGVATAIETCEHPDAVEQVHELVAALDWSGVANVDLRVDVRDGRVTVLEVNPRYWSSLLASDAAGVAFPHLACLAALGIAFATPRPRAQRFVQAKASVRAWSRRLLGRGAPLALRETIWPYLVADPAPHLMGRVHALAARRAA